MKAHKPYTIGISIAEPTDMEKWGINAIHIKDAMVQIARNSISSGYAISYGGDLEYRGFINFTELLREIVLRYSKFQQEGNLPNKLITNYYAWHLSAKASEATKRNFSKFINIITTPPPIEVNGQADTKQSNIKTIDKARSLSTMREVMNNEIDARVLLGGKITGFSGIYPGLLEEAYLALKSKKPLFLLGGFGGCTHKIVEIIQKRRPPEITLEYQIEQDTDKKALFQDINNVATQNPHYKINKVDYHEIVSFFEQVGTSGLNNGLSEDENQTLFESKNINQMLYLLFKGLSSLSQGR